MKVYPDYDIRGGTAALNEVLAGIISRARGHWSIDSDSGRTGDGQDLAQVLVLQSHARFPSARLWMFWRDSRTCLSITQIVPMGAAQALSEEEYNGVVRLFHDELAGVPASDNGCECIIGSPIETIEDHLSKDACKALQVFSSRGFKDTAAFHPEESARWCDFVVQVHRGARRPPLGVIERWLYDDGWSSDVVPELMCRLSQELDLLKYYDTLHP